MQLRCRACGSKDLWQPRRHMSAYDNVLAKGGYQRVDCRNCRNRFVVSMEDWKEFLKASSPSNGRAAAPVKDDKPEPVAAQPPEPASTVIGSRVRIRGELYCHEDVRVYGELQGTVEASGCEILIEHGGTVAATVKAGYIEVHGALRDGHVTSDRLMICHDGSLTGDAKTNSLVVEEGAYLRGRLEPWVEGETKG